MKLLPNRFVRPLSIALAVAVGFAVAYLASADAGPNQRSSQCGPGAVEPARLGQGAGTAGTVAKPVQLQVR
jgi:hypothetical protein